MTDLTSHTIAELRDGLAKKTFSSAEVTRAYLERIEKNSDLNGYIEVCRDVALQSAAIADERIASGESLPLLGVPIAVKDVISTKGIRTTCASRILENFVPPYNATVVTKLLDAGAFVLGKTNMDEFAMGSSNENSHFGPVKNPWDKSCVPGGSSGGSAVVVSAHLAPASLGTDTGGSIRQPASFCSVVGIKPSYGRVSRYGVVAFASSLDQVGPMARNVKDCATLTSVLCGHDPKDSTSVSRDVVLPDSKELDKFLGSGIRGLRVGMPKEYFIKGVNAEVDKAVRDAIAKLNQLGAEVVEITLPHTEEALAVYYILAPAECSSNLARFDGVRYGHRAKDAKNLADLYRKSRSEGFGKEVQRRIMIGTYVLSSGYYDAYYLRAQKARTLIVRDFTDAFEKCDVIACPVAPSTAFKLGQHVSDPLEMYLNDIFTIPVNLAGLPGMSIPCGFDSKGLPIGLQLIGKQWDESTLLRTAAAYEQATEWHAMNPQNKNPQ